MKVLFCFDGPISTDGKNYYSTALTNKVLSRYKFLADKITIAMKVKNIKKNTLKDQVTKITSSGVNVVHMPNISSLKGQFFFKKSANKILEKEIENSEIIIARIPSLIGFTAIDIARKHNKPYIIELVACAWDSYWNHSFKGKLIAPIMYQATKKRVAKAEYVTYVSRNFLQERYPTGGNFLSISDVELKSSNEDILKERLMKIDKISNDKSLSLGTVGNMGVGYKGQKYVIEAISILKEKGYDFVYYLVGGGDQSKLRKIAAKYNVIDRVKFIGPLAHDNIFEFIKDIDIYIQPSDAESHGRAVVEAMSTAVPIIGSSTGGIPELVSNRFIFQRKNVSDLAEKLIQMNKKAMKEEAKKNYCKAGEFEKDMLDKKRKEFYSKFLYQYF